MCVERLKLFTAILHMPQVCYTFLAAAAVAVGAAGAAGAVEAGKLQADHLPDSSAVLRLTISKCEM